MGAFKSTAGTTNATTSLAVGAQRVLPQVLLYGVLIAGLIVFIWPMAWLVSASLKPTDEVYKFPPNLIPSRIDWTAYPEVLKQFNFLHGLGNTMAIVVGVIVGQLLSCSLTAFAFARIRVRFRDTLFIVVLATMMLPYQVTLIPQFLVFRDLHWLNTFYPLIVPSFFATNAYTVFMLRQFFMTIPREYDDAAFIDGCGYFGTFWRIIIPQSLPALGVVSIFAFTGTWNDFFGPLIYLNDIDKMTLAVALAVYNVARSNPGAAYSPITYLLALTAMMTAFPIAAFFIAQRYFIQGVVLSGIKG
jgi:ABC-type glycerol-3-phosphate transport system permease component